MQALPSETAILVIGAGSMGAGIAQVAAVAGHRVYLYDQLAVATEKAIASIDKNLQYLHSKHMLTTEAAHAIRSRLCPINDLNAGRSAGLVIEAIVEQLAIKQQLFLQLESIVSEQAILTSNTSSISITALASVLKNPQRFLGMHFFNPAPRMALVEIVRGLASDLALAECLIATAKSWGKVPVLAQSTPGFIVNRVARPFYGEALRVLSELGAEIANLDAIMRESCAFPMGPFALMDMIGHDINFAVTQSIYSAFFGDKRYTPSLIQQELVYAGRLGKKTGRGFYDYGAGAPLPAPTILPPAPKPQSLRVLGNMGIAEGLIARWQKIGITISREHIDQPNGSIEVGGATIMLTDGRTASVRAKAESINHLVLFDLAWDYDKTALLALTRADGCSESAWQGAVGALQANGINIVQLDDVAGMMAMRTVCMLANEAGDAVLQGVASASDINLAMKNGTNYPSGPLEWAEKIGVAQVVQVLEHLREHYGEERYRLSAYLRRWAIRASNR